MITAMKAERRDGLYLRGQTWWMSYRVGRRRVRESTGFADRRAAELVLAKVRVGIKEGLWFGKRKDVTTPLGPAIEEFLTLYSRPRKASWQDDKVVLERFHRHAGSDAVLQQVDRLSIDRFLKGLRARGLSSSRVNQHIATLKCFWNRQIEWGKATVNPVKGIKLYPETMKTEYLEAGQVRALLESCSSRLRPIVEAAVLTGLRRGDLLNLRWDTVDLDRRRISVVQGKTGSRLTIHIIDPLARLLSAVAKHPDCPYVFQDDGRALRKFGWIRTDYLAACKAAGLPEHKRRFHTLRHTVATQLRFLGKDLAIIKEQLGHKSLRMTLRYAHIAPEELKRAAEELGEKLVGAPATDPLVTIWSQSAPHATDERMLTSKNESSFRNEIEPTSFGQGGMQRAVNGTEGRREVPEDDPLRRADDDWG